MELFAGIALILLLAVVVSLGLAITVFWIWMLIDAVQNRGINNNEKVCWVLAIVFFHVLGSLLYLLIGRPKRNTPRLNPA